MQAMSCQNHPSPPPEGYSKPPEPLTAPERAQLSRVAPIESSARTRWYSGRCPARGKILATLSTRASTRLACKPSGGVSSGVVTEANLACGHGSLVFLQGTTRWSQAKASLWKALRAGEVKLRQF